MNKKRLKLKKWVWFILIVIIFLSIGIISFIKIKNNYVYKRTITYKLLEFGYNEEEVNLFKKYLNENELNDLLKENTKNNTLLKLMQDNNYIHNNLERYLNYLKYNHSNNYADVIFKVNLNLDYEFYDNAKEADLSKDNLLLVNKYYYLDSSFIPTDLVEISTKYAWGEGKEIKKVVYDAFLNMWNDAYKEDIYLIINLGYRSYENQEKIYNNLVNAKNKGYADSIAARPGFSEHQTGLALDIFEKSNSNTQTFKDSNAYLWLKENAYKYGFILRYTEENEYITGFNDEPWHYRYVGLNEAKYIYEHNITLEEYITYFA